MTQWQDTLFDEMCRKGFYYDRIDLESAQKDVQQWRDVLPISNEAKFLDLGCGNGRYTFALAELGIRAVGADIAKELLKLANQKSEELRLPCVFIEQDMRTMDYLMEFDAVIMMDCTFGLFDDATNQSVMEGVRRALKPGGKALMEVFNPYYWAIHQKTYRWHINSADWVREYGFDPALGSITDKLICYGADGKTELEKGIYRSYTLPEFRLMSLRAGFSEMEVRGRDANWTLTHPLDVSTSPVFEVLLTRP